MTDTGQLMSPVLIIEMDRLPESSLIVYFAVSKLKSGTVNKIKMLGVYCSPQGKTRNN